MGWNATGFIMQHLSQLGDSLTGPSQANVFVFVYLSRTCPCSPTPQISCPERWLQRECAPRVDATIVYGNRNAVSPNQPSHPALNQPFAKDKSFTMLSLISASTSTRPRKPRQSLLFRMFRLSILSSSFLFPVSRLASLLRGFS